MAFLWAGVALGFLLQLPPPTAGLVPEVITSRRGAVASDDRRCSRIGRGVLREGGHAVDAAVAAALCLGVVSPTSSGIGGGAFMLVRSASLRYEGDRSLPWLPPRICMLEMLYLKEGSGALSIAVPGEVAGLHEAWKHYGKLPWERPTGDASSTDC